MKVQTPYGEFSFDADVDKKIAAMVAHGSWAVEVDPLIPFLASPAADVGANIGSFAIALAPYVNELHCFEPIERNLTYLKENTKQLPQVTIHATAVGAKEGSVSFDGYEGDPGGYAITAEQGDIPLQPLKNFGYFPFIKIDVEGYEGEVLKGMAPGRPVVFVEISTMTRARTPLREFKRLLPRYRWYTYRAGRWYNIHSPLLGYMVILPGALFFTKRGYHMDVLALPDTSKKIEAKSVLTLVPDIFVRLYHNYIR